MQKSLSLTIAEFFVSNVAKTVGASALTAILGFTAHTVWSVHDQEHKLVEHDTAIVKLQEGENETHRTLEDVRLSVARVEGKIDVLNQKVDDRQHEIAHDPQPPEHRVYVAAK